MKPKLITELTEIKEYLPAQMSTAFNVVGPYLGAAERTYVASLVGKTQFDAFADAYTAAGKKVSDISDEHIRAAVRFCQAVAVNAGYYLAAPVLSVSISDAGIQVNSSENRKQAFNWQVDDLKKSLLDLAFSGIEELLEYMAANIISFPAYAASEQYRRQTRFLIRSAADFSDHFNIQASRYVFSCISYVMQRVELQSVEPVFGAAFFADLKVAGLEGKRKVLVNQYLKPGIALITASKALRERIITFEHGVASVNLIGNYSTAQRQLPVDQGQIDAACEQLYTDGDKFLSDGLQFIQDNADYFPDFQTPAVQMRWNVENQREKGVWAN